MAVDLASRLNRKVALLHRHLTKDAYGGAVEIWKEGATIFAGVEFLNGNEHFAQKAIPQAEARTEARIRIRSRRGLDPAAIRIKFGPTVFDVLAVVQDWQNYETQLMVKARALDQGPGEAVNP